MQLYSSDNSIFITKSLDCYWDLRVNPLFVGSSSTGGFSLVTNNTNTVLLTGNGSTVPLQAAVKISAQSGNALSSISDGLFVSSSSTSTYTDTEARAALSGNSPILYNSTTGVIGITLASSVNTGAISATDWNTFNTKISDAANIGTGVDGFKQRSGTILEFRRFTGGTGISVVQSGDSVLITNTATPYTDAQARASISATAPLSYNSSTGVMSITQSSTSVNGYLSSTDWNIFNSKVSPTRLINTTFPLLGGGNLSSDLTLSIASASTSTSGYLTSTDWNIFNGKQDVITWNNVTIGSSKIALGGTPVGAVKNAFSIDVVEANILLPNLGGVLPISLGGTNAITAPLALINLLPSQAGQSGKVLGTDGTNAQWVTGGVGGGGENPLTFTAPLTRVGNTISIPVATSSVNGYISSVDFSLFSNKVNDGINLGATGASVFTTKSGTNLQFRKIIAGTNLIVVENANDITISSNIVGTGTAHAINATVSELATNTTPDLTRPYYITDKGREGFFYYDSTDTTTLANGNGIVIVGQANRRWKRSYSGPVQLSWFDAGTLYVNAKSDYVFVGLVDNGSTGANTGAFNPTDMTGTDNTPALNNAMNAVKDNETIEIGNTGTGWLFKTPIAQWSNAKTRRLLISGNTYHPAVDFIKIIFSGGIDKHHYVEQNGRAIGRENIPFDTKGTFDAATGPNWNAFTGTFITIYNSSKKKFKLNYVTGFKNAMEFQGESEGCQENVTEFQWFHQNDVGISMKSINGSSYIDKNYFRGGRLSGRMPIKMDGYQAYIVPSGVNAGLAEPYNGAFRSNEFHNCLFEHCERMIEMKGECTENLFSHCTIEGGVPTGVFDPFNAIFLRTLTTDTPFSSTSPNVCRNTIFYSCNVMDIQYFAENGKKTQIIGGSIWAPNGGQQVQRYLGIGAETDNAGKFTVYANTAENLTFLASDKDSITYKNTLKPTSQYISARLSGLTKTISYDGLYQEISVAGNTTLSVPIGLVKLIAGASATTLVMQDDQIFDGQLFYIEQTGTGTTQIVKQSNTATVVMTTAQITTTGIYLVRYSAGAFLAFKLGGSGGVLSVGAIGTGTALGASISGTAISLHNATSTQAGILNPAVTNQVIGGDKTFAGILMFTNLTGSTTRMLTVAADGTVGAQAIPTGGTGTTYIFSTGLSEAGGTVTNNLITGIAASNQLITGSVNSGGDLTLRSTSNVTKGQIIAQDSLVLRANTVNSNTAPIVFDNTSTVLMSGLQNGALQWNATDLFITNAVDGVQKIATATNNLVFTFKTWQGATVSPGYGGTGQSIYTAGDLLYATGATTLAKLPIGTAGQTLGVQAGLPVWTDLGGWEWSVYTMTITGAASFTTIATKALDSDSTGMFIVDAVAINTTSGNGYRRTFQVSYVKIGLTASLTGNIDTYAENFDSSAMNLNISPSIYTVSGDQNLQIQVQGPVSSATIIWKVSIRKLAVNIPPAP